MINKRMLPLLGVILILAGCFRTAEDSFDTVGSENSGTIGITQQVNDVQPTPTETSSVTIIDPNATSTPVGAEAESVDASATPRVISVTQATEDAEPNLVATATRAVSTSSPPSVPTATEPSFVTPDIVEEVVQPSATPTEIIVESTLQPTPTAFGALVELGECDYEVQSGDNLFRIALRNNVSLSELLTANGLTEASIIQPGQILTIPNCNDTSPEDTDAVEDTGTVPTPVVLEDCEYEIQSGDTLFRIAIENDVTLIALLEENGLPENAVIQPGQILTIPNCVSSTGSESEVTGPDIEVEVTEVVEQPTETMHTVVSGDTLLSIARQYGVTVNSIISSNAIPDINNLTVGQQLTIPDAQD